MKRPAPPIPTSSPSPSPVAPSGGEQAGAPSNNQESYFDKFYNYMVDPSLTPNGGEQQNQGGENQQQQNGEGGEGNNNPYWDSLISGATYTKDVVGAGVGAVGTYASSWTKTGEQPTGEGQTPGAPGAPGAGGAGGAPGGGEGGVEGESSWGTVTRQTTEATSAIGESLSSWYYGKEGEEGEERQPGFQDTIGSYASYIYTTGAGENDPNAPPPAEGDPNAPPADPDAPYLQSWFIPEEKEGEPPVQIEKVDLDSMVSGFFSNTATSLRNVADYGPAPPSRVKPPAPARAAPQAAPSARPTPANNAAPPRPRPTSVATPMGRAPPPRPSSTSKGMIGGNSGSAGAPPRPTSSRPGSMARPSPAANSPMRSTPATNSPVRSTPAANSPVRPSPAASSPVSRTGASTTPGSPCNQYKAGFGVNAGNCRTCKTPKGEHP